jgi:hypothetical protein
VDDLFLTGNGKHIVDCRRKLASKFEMKDLGMMHYFLGLEVWKKPDEIFLSQGKYAVEILKIFKMIDCKSMSTPMVKNLKLLIDNSSEIVDVTMYRNMIGSLMYFTNTRPNICFVVNNLSQYMVERRCVHLIAENHILRYLKGMRDFSLQHVLDHKIILQGYADSYWSDNVSVRKSRSGCCFSLGSTMISCLNRKHTIVALSTTEA